MKKFFISVALAASALTMSAGNGWPANYGGVMLQGFYWDSYDDSKWTALTDRADELSQYFDLIWIPNAGTTSGDRWAMNNNGAFPTQMGYMPCFWLDYNTIFGNEAELRTMIDTYREKGVGIIEDVVINHKNGVSGWCDFPDETVVGKNTGKTYMLTWDNTNYTGICCNDEANSNNDSGVVGHIGGNEDTGDGFDGCRDLDHRNEQVRNNIKVYLDYLLNELGFAGFRYDMVKGYGAQYVGEYNQATNPEFSVGEYWDDENNTKSWLEYTKNYSDQIQSAAFDFALKTQINKAFNNDSYGELSYTSFTTNTNYSRYSVTFAENHDTWREDDKSKALNYNWSAANAFILTLPGTPCIFYKHYLADPTNIGAMILARKKAGITNQTQPTRQYVWDNGGYELENVGPNGRVFCEFGTAVDHAPTANDCYLVASGDGYRFYYAENSADGSRVVYFDNSQANWSNVHGYTWNNGTKQNAADWPGTQLEQTSEGYYKMTIPSGCDMVIFNNGSNASQTANLSVVDNMIYTHEAATGKKLYVPTGNSILTSTHTENIKGSNVVNMSAKPYQCYNLVITDGYKYDCDVNFTAGKASYSRQSSSQWGTLCLPFAAKSNNDVQYYTLSSATDETLTFRTIDSFEAGQPVVYKVLSDKNGAGKYELNIESTATNVVTKPKVVSPIEGWTMEGSFEPITCKSSDNHHIYYIAQNQFWEAEEETSAGAFRAWFGSTSTLTANSSFRIVEETPTGVTAVVTPEMEQPTYYNLSGQRQSGMKQGVNIVNGKKIILN